MYIIDANTPWKSVLDELVRYLNNASSNNAQNLWNVLSALRGPDSDVINVKLATTSVIRHKIGIFSSSVGAVVKADSAESLDLRNQKFPSFTTWNGNINLSSWDHFSYHALLAFKALGLKWEQQNYED